MHLGCFNSALPLQYNLSAATAHSSEFKKFKVNIIPYSIQTPHIFPIFIWLILFILLYSLFKDFDIYKLFTFFYDCLYQFYFLSYAYAHFKTHCNLFRGIFHLNLSLLQVSSQFWLHEPNLKLLSGFTLAASSTLLNSMRAELYTNEPGWELHSIGAASNHPSARKLVSCNVPGFFT